MERTSFPRRLNLSHPSSSRRRPEGGDPSLDIIAGSSDGSPRRASARMTKVLAHRIRGETEAAREGGHRSSPCYFFVAGAAEHVTPVFDLLSFTRFARSMTTGSRRIWP